MRCLCSKLLMVFGLLFLSISEDCLGAGEKPAPKPRPHPAMPRPAAHPTHNNGDMQFVMRHHDLEVSLADDADIRSMSPPDADFDEKGNRKKPSPEELKKLKGDTPREQKLPGYKIDFNKVQIGDLVKITLGKPKDSPNTAKPNASTTSTKEEDPKDPPRTAYIRSGELIGKVIEMGTSLQFTVRIDVPAMQNGHHHMNNNRNNNNVPKTTISDRVATRVVVQTPANPN